MVQQRGAALKRTTWEINSCERVAREENSCRGGKKLHANIGLHWKKIVVREGKIYRGRKGCRGREELHEKKKVAGEKKSCTRRK